MKLHSKSQLAALVAALACVPMAALAQSPAPAPAPATAPAATPADAKAKSGGLLMDRQELETELRELEDEYERVRRTQGEGGLHRQGLNQKLAAKRKYTEFHLRLLDQFDAIQRRLDALDKQVANR